MGASKSKARKVCQHCQRKQANRPRVLCWTCYYTPGLRDQYPSQSKFARKGVATGTGGPSKEPVPTAALPATEEKLAVMEQRARDGLSLFHRRDAIWDGTCQGTLVSSCGESRGRRFR